MTHALQLDHLTRRYGDFIALDDVSFSVEPGEVFGFMGHNGAGKTTAIKLLLGLTRPTSGHARVFGVDSAQDALGVRRVTGYLPASYALPRDMTPRSFLAYVGAMRCLPEDVVVSRTDALLARFGLTAVIDRKLGAMSTGMAQKVGLAQALLGEPRLLLLDEPTAGLDPLGRHELLTLLRELATEHGTTVLFSSHILSDVEATCSRVAILHRGRLLASGALATLKAEHAVTTTDELYLALALRAAA